MSASQLRRFLADVVEHGKEHDAFDIDIGASGPADDVLEFGDLDPLAGAVEGVHDDGRGRQIEALSQRRRGDRDLEDVVAQQALDLFAIGGRKRAVM